MGDIAFFPADDLIESCFDLAAAFHCDPWLIMSHPAREVAEVYRRVAIWQQRRKADTR